MAHFGVYEEPDLACYTTTKLNFRPSIYCLRDAAHPPTRLTAYEATEKIAAEWGTSRLCEAISADDVVKPFFDFDLKLADTPTAEFLEHTLERDFIKPICNALGCDASAVAVAKSHGFVTGEIVTGYKVSFRGFVQGFKVRVADMRSIVGPGSEPLNAPFDWRVYPTAGERVLRCVGAIKGTDPRSGREDTRVLVPLDSTRPYTDYLVQFLEGGEAMVDNENPRPRRRARVATASPATTRPSWLDVSDAEAIFSTQKALTSAGMISGYTFDRQIRNVLHFKTAGNRKCCFGVTHHSNNFGCVLTREGNIEYTCHGSACDGRKRVIGRWRELDVASACDFEALTPEQLREFDPDIPGEAQRMLLAANPDVVTKSGKPDMEAMEDYPRLVGFQRKYLGHFFKHVTGLAKPEILQLTYDEHSRPVAFVRRTLMDTAQVTRAAGREAFNNWLTDSKKVTYAGYVSMMDRSKVPANKFNLLFGSRPFEVLIPFIPAIFVC